MWVEQMRLSWIAKQLILEFPKNVILKDINLLKYQSAWFLEIMNESYCE